MIGKASIEILEGRRELKADIEQPHMKRETTVDPKTLYAMKMGSEFAAGFVYGIGFGGFDEKEIFECLKKEPTADAIFLQADEDLNNSIVNNDAQLAVKGLSEMVWFIIDMGKEIK